MRRATLFAALLLASVLVAACATTRPVLGCYPHVFLDGRFAIRGIQLADTVESSGCYQFQGSGDRVTRIDYRRDGELAPDPLFGVATILVDRSGGYERRTYLETQGQPTVDHEGVHAVWVKYDREGNALEWRNLGVDGRLVEGRKSELAILRWTYDLKGNTLEESYWDAGEQRKDDRLRGVAIVRWRYDERGNTIEEGYFDARERPKEDQLKGVSMVRWQYDLRGPAVEERYFGADKRLKQDQQRGVAVIRWLYDRSGRLVEQRYLGPDEQLTGDKQRGVAVVRWTYDRRGNYLTRLTFDKDDRLIPEPQ